MVALSVELESMSPDLTQFHFIFQLGVVERGGGGKGCGTPRQACARDHQINSEDRT